MGWSTTAAAALVSGNYFRGAGVAIARGRSLTDDDDRPGASAAVISYRFWMTALGGDEAVLGKPMRVNGVPFTIVGVSGPGFVGMSRGGFFPPMDVTLPLHAQPAVRPTWGPPGESLFTSDVVFWIHSMARIREGTSIAPLQSRLAAAFAGWMKASSVPSYQAATNVEVRLLPGGRGLDELSRRAGQPVRILTGVVAIVLLLACVNLANLMLARGVAKTKEISIRLALGSGRGAARAAGADREPRPGVSGGRDWRLDRRVRRARVAAHADGQCRTHRDDRGRELASARPHRRDCVRRHRVLRRLPCAPTGSARHRPDDEVRVGRRRRPRRACVRRQS